jgi:aminopeptidase N
LANHLIDSFLSNDKPERQTVLMTNNQVLNSSLIISRSSLKSFMRFFILAVFLLGFFYFSVVSANAQSAASPASTTAPVFSHADSLRGSLRPQRTAYDVLFYDLNISVNPENQSISGSNTIRYQVLESVGQIQIDLFANMAISEITQQGKPLAYVRDGNAVFITVPTQPICSVQSLKISYSGKPQIAAKPPWDGGFVWQTDSLTGCPWVAVACEGTGASLWWPNKDHLSDEPDSMRITCRVPYGLVCISNGTLVGKRLAKNNQTEWTWAVHYPINNYNVTLNIADYTHIQDEYMSLDKQLLRLDYYVLPANADTARIHFQQVKGMLDCYERYFGKFPFWRDGYKLVEAPYWGMEHQTAVAYGNHYQNNEFGFDFIIIHESGHEYFGNSLSCADPAEMWLHESFTTYAEALYVECTHSLSRAQTYLNNQRKFIKNQHPMIGPMGVNYNQPDNDIYVKGAWMLHSLRHAVSNDKLWFGALKALCTKKRLSVVDTDAVIDFLTTETKTDLRPLLNQYLRQAALPVLEYQTIQKNDRETELRCRWVADSEGFNLPVKVRFGFGEWQTIYPTRKWQTVPLLKTVGWFNVGTEFGLFVVRPVVGQ